ncbi:MAG: hypothetical protein KDB14_22485 [Planctomycetales bacterium]|nr:hypothetical protein [Planctomycetales bacterium]
MSTRSPAFPSLWLRSTLIVALLLGAAMPARGQVRGGFRVPQAGNKLPDVKLLDEQGRDFSTSTLKDHYTVLVFGCLT